MHVCSVREEIGGGAPEEVHAACVCARACVRACACACVRRSVILL